MICILKEIKEDIAPKKSKQVKNQKGMFIAWKQVLETKKIWT